MPYTALEKIVIGDVTQENLATGQGNFDILMRALKEHVNKEYKAGRIDGPEYSQVYLATLQLALDKAMGFTMEVDKSWLEAEILRLTAEKLEIEKTKVTAEVALVNAQIGLINQQTANAVVENTVLIAQECKLRAEYDVLLLQKDKVIAETALLGQKLVTEQAQTQDGAIAPGSVLGKQIVLYGRQADGFLRDAEQKAAKLMIDTWNVRRTTDEATVAGPIPGGADNGLGDIYIGRAVGTMLTGINA